MRGVTVTLMSSVLQVPQIVRVTDGQGSYQSAKLAVGSYRLTYELAGFARLVRKDITGRLIANVGIV